MVKPEWGTKRTCPKCATRFYDLGKDDPVACIECGNEWEPEPILKSKQPLPFENKDEKVKEKEAESKDQDLSEDEDLDISEDDEDPVDDDNDLGGDDDLGVKRPENSDEE
ncbi:TIGR02300 family protein [Stakelama saccharophila]|uniref:TIGR02300 family protein n=1 Tax=Stakelama saccharophila TaxID=3075605 RepID=A0ABZ0B8Y4_9SPHN|nr:TIGR02300 family protein [Stakelama sp. W311]WNO53066.1 TIGR02300 family protein [Stakelama sp. W311]